MIEVRRERARKPSAHGRGLTAAHRALPEERLPSSAPQVARGIGATKTSAFHPAEEKLED